MRYCKRLLIAKKQIVSNITGQGGGRILIGASKTIGVDTRLIQSLGHRQEIPQASGMAIRTERPYQSRHTGLGAITKDDRRNPTCRPILATTSDAMDMLVN